MNVNAQPAKGLAIPFDHHRLDRLMDEAGIDVVLAGLNHKMGFRGTVNTVLGFGEGEYRPGGQAGAVGYMVGEPNRGLG